MSTDLAVVERPTIDPAIMEQVIINGDLSQLSAEQRLSYYDRLCDSLGLNPLSKPFAYIKLNGKLTLYALKDCTEQLRTIHQVSITKVEERIVGDLFIATAYARNRAGREDVSTGAVPIKGLLGETLANATMKAETKAKRRVTLSICGLGMLDETEADSIPNAQVISDMTQQNGTTAQESGVQTSSLPERTIDTMTGEITDPPLPSAAKIRARFQIGARRGSSDLATAKQIEVLMTAIYTKTDSDVMGVPVIRYLHQNKDMEMTELTKGAHSELTEMVRLEDAAILIRALYGAAQDFLAEPDAPTVTEDGEQIPF